MSVVRAVLMLCGGQEHQGSEQGGARGVAHRARRRRRKGFECPNAGSAKAAPSGLASQRKPRPRC